MEEIDGSFEVTVYDGYVLVTRSGAPSWLLTPQVAEHMGQLLSQAAFLAAAGRNGVVTIARRIGGDDPPA